MPGTIGVGSGGYSANLLPSAGLCLPGAYLLDLVVEDKVLVEAKTVDQFVDVHFAQVNSYLRFSGLELGLLLNFRTRPLKDGGIKRVIKSYT